MEERADGLAVKGATMALRRPGLLRARFDLTCHTDEPRLGVSHLLREQVSARLGAGLPDDQSREAAESCKDVESEGRGRRPDSSSFRALKWTC